MSTPIETNTEQLQEVLQQVYNLPSRSGGSTTPDLVISFAKEYLNVETLPTDAFSIKAGSVASTFQKLKNKEEVKVFMEHEYFYGDTKFTGVFYPVTITAGDLYDGTQCLLLNFITSSYPGFSYRSQDLSITLQLDGTVAYAKAMNIGL